MKKLRKNGEANVPSGRPTQNYCATKHNYYYYYHFASTKNGEKDEYIKNLVDGPSAYFCLRASIF